MDACDPDTDTGNIQNFIKLHTGRSPKISREKLCEISKNIKANKLPLPPLVLSKDKKFMIDSKSPLTQKDYERMFSSSVKSAEMKRIARKSGLSEVDKTIQELKNAVGRRLRSLNVREPIQLHSRRDVIVSMTPGNNNNSRTPGNNNSRTPTNNNSNRSPSNKVTTLMNELKRKRRMKLLKKFTGSASTRGNSQPAPRENSQPATRGNSQPAPRPNTRGNSQPATRGNSQPATRGNSQPATRGNSQPATRGNSQPAATRGNSQSAATSGNSIQVNTLMKNKKGIYELLTGKKPRGKFNANKIENIAKSIGLSSAETNEIKKQYIERKLTDEQVLEKLRRIDNIRKIETKLKLIVNNNVKRNQFMNAYKSGAMNNKEVVKAAEKYRDAELNAKAKQLRNETTLKLKELNNRLKRAPNRNQYGLRFNAEEMKMMSLIKILELEKQKQNPQTDKLTKILVDRINAIEQKVNNREPKIQERVENLKTSVKVAIDKSRDELREMAEGLNGFNNRINHPNANISKLKIEIVLEKEKKRVLALPGLNNSMKARVKGAATVEEVQGVEQIIRAANEEDVSNNDNNSINARGEASKKAQQTENARREAQEANNAKKAQEAKNLEATKERLQAKASNANINFTQNILKLSKLENVKTLENKMNEAISAKAKRKAQQTENARRETQEANNAKKAQEAKNLEAAKKRLQAKASGANIKFTKNILKLSKLENVKTLEEKMNKAIIAKAEKTKTPQNMKSKNNKKAPALPAPKLNKRNLVKKRLEELKEMSNRNASNDREMNFIEDEMPRFNNAETPDEINEVANMILMEKELIRRPPLIRGGRATNQEVMKATKEKAATKLQAAFRGKQNRKKAEEIKKEAAAASKFRRVANGVVASRRAATEKMPTMNQLQNLGKLKKLQAIQRAGTRLTPKQTRELRSLATISQQGQTAIPPHVNMGMGKVHEKPGKIYTALLKKLREIHEIQKNPSKKGAGYVSQGRFNQFRTTAKGLLEKKKFNPVQMGTYTSLINSSGTVPKLIESLEIINTKVPLPL